MQINYKFNIYDTVYMRPTQYNGLKHITAYKILSIELMAIGLRYHLRIKKKEKGIEEFYCAIEEELFENEEHAKENIK